MAGLEPARQAETMVHQSYYAMFHAAAAVLLARTRNTNGLWLRPIHAVMAGLVPAIHACEFIVVFKTWMPATSAGMTSQN